MRKYPFAFFLVCLILASCAGLKKKDQPRYDFMDNLTSRYNIIHHGREIIAEAERQNREAYVPVFHDYLPILIEPSEGSAASHRLLMDSVLEKSRRVINEKDEGKYVSSAYFLRGQANYLKGHYYDAAEFFAYVANTYADKPKLRQDAWIWQARSLLRLGNYVGAVPVLDSVLAYAGDVRRNRGMAYATRAQLHLERGETRETILYLKGALNARADRADKLRWHYLTAQLLEGEQLYSEALNHYKKVARSNVSYEMAFQAQLKMTLIESATNRGQNEATRRLARMLRDGKNKEFKDQIYYFIAETHLYEGDEEEAIRNYKHSLAQNSLDRHQSTWSYLSLADLYLSGKDYEHAKLYYDSAASTLPADFRQVDKVRKKLLSMDRLLQNLKLIGEQDLYLRLADMNPEAQNVFLDSLAREEFNRENGDEQAVNGQQVSNQQPLDRGFSSSNINAFADNRFYFNNPDAVGMGVSAFRRQWGNRELQDNWRFSSEWNFAAMAVATDEVAASGEMEKLSEEAVDVWDAFSRKFRDGLIGKIPSDAPAVQLSHEAIRGALEDNAEIYRIGLEDVSNSMDTYENLLTRYPEDERVASWLYQLHRLTLSVGDGRAIGYKDRLLGNYSSSIYAQIVLDPLFFQKQAAQKSRSDQRYSAIYRLYGDGEYEEVIRAVNEESSHGESHVQLDYLRALALGRTSTYEVLQQALVTLVEKYPDDILVTPLVRQQLEFILTHQADFANREIALLDSAGVSPQFLGDSRLTPWPQLVIDAGPVITRGIPEPVLARSTVGIPTVTSSSALPMSQLREVPALIRSAGQTTYRDLEVLPDTGVYYFVIHVIHPGVNLAPSRFGVGQFNRSRYSGKDISHQLKAVNNESQLIYVGPFSTFEEVKIYEARITPLLDDIMKVPVDIYQTFLITEMVFGTLSDFGKIDDYFNFYIAQ